MGDLETQEGLPVLVPPQMEWLHLLDARELAAAIVRACDKFEELGGYGDPA